MSTINNTVFSKLLQVALDELYNASKSRKQTEYTLNDAIKHKHLGTPRTKTIIDASVFLNSNPLKNNDYFKYIDAYVNSNIKLDTHYFRHDLKKLNEYYRKYDELKINPFDRNKYNEYVLYISLKLLGGYDPINDDKLFNVIIKDNREYNPLTKIPSVLRGELHFEVKEYDIKRAFPTFIDIELNTDFRINVYDIISKKDFAIAINSHNESNVSIEDARAKLKPVYQNRVDEVLTESRFNERGKTFKDLSYYELDFINKFVKSNEIENFARLHDGIFVLNNVECKNLIFDKVEFSIKECIKPDILNKVVLFYEFDIYGCAILTPTGICDFLKQEKFVRISNPDDKIQLLKNNNNVIDYFNFKTDIVSFLESKIIEVNKTPVKDAIARHNFSTIAQSFLLIEPTILEYYKDDKTRFGLPFKNGFIYFDNLDKFSLKTKPYKEIKGFFAPHQVQKIKFDYTTKIGDFETFISRVSTGNKEYKPDAIEFKSLCSIIGYLSNTYKKPNENPIIVFTDEGANDESRNGRRGKSLITMGLGNVMKKIVKGGNEFDASYRHNFAELDKSHNLYVIDDAPAGFIYNDLYTVATGGISIQPKGSKAVELDFKDTPKFVVTTNYIFRLNKDDASSVARFIEFKFKPYYSNEYRPENEFKKLFFDEWDATEWNKFYSFIYRCVFNYLKNGITRIDYNKDIDNYNATFSDHKEDAIRLILEQITEYNNSFNVSDFLKAFNELDKSIVNEKYFNHKNCKSNIETFIKGNENYSKYKYNQRAKKWEHSDPFN